MSLLAPSRSQTNTAWFPSGENADSVSKPSYAVNCDSRIVGAGCSRVRIAGHRARTADRIRTTPPPIPSEDCALKPALTMGRPRCQRRGPGCRLLLPICWQDRLLLCCRVPRNRPDVRREPIPQLRNRLDPLLGSIPSARRTVESGTRGWPPRRTCRATAPRSTPAATARGRHCARGSAAARRSWAQRDRLPVARDDMTRDVDAHGPERVDIR